jgi:uncharacterized repeat protein (TIGR01451 family)
LSVSGSGPSSVALGGQVTYTLTVTNNSSSAQSNVTLTDDLPAGTTFVSWAPQSGWSFSAPATGSSSGAVTAWIPSLAANSSASFTLVVQVDSTFVPSFIDVSDTASVGPITGDLSPSNNSVTLIAPLPYIQSPSNAGQLLYDIALANFVGGATTFTLAAGATFDFTAANDPANGGNAMPVINGNNNNTAITIVGNGDTSDTIERTGTTPFRLFDVAPGGSLTLENLTLTGGLAQGTGTAAEGGAIYSSGTLSLSGVKVQNNRAVGSAGANATALSPIVGPGASAYGGGVYANGGAVTLTNDTTFSGDTALGGAGGNAAGFAANGTGGAGGAGSGGGLYLAAGTVTLSNDILSGNSAKGGGGGTGGLGGGAGGAGSGGGLYVAAGTVTLSNTTLSGNTALGGSGGAAFFAAGSGGAGSGGALYAAADTVRLSNDTLSGNTALGGSGGGGKAAPGGVGGSGGVGSGGALYAAADTVTLSNDTLSGNNAKGGSGGAGRGSVGGVGGGSGGVGLAGGLYVARGNLALTNDTLSGNQAQGGNGGAGFLTDGGVILGHGRGGAGGAGSGGGIYAAAGTVTLSNDTLSGNNAKGGTGGTGGSGHSGGAGGAGSGGGLYEAGDTVTLSNDTLSGNNAKGGSGGAGGFATGFATGGNGGSGGNGSGGGLFIYSGSVITLHNTLTAENTVTAGTGGAGGKGQKGNGAPGASGSASAPDVSGNVASSDHDLIGDGSGSNLTNGSNGDQVGSVSFTGDLTMDQPTTIKNVSSMTGLFVGQLVTDTAAALPAGTVITFLGTDTITLSQAATASQTADGFTSSVHPNLGPLQNNGGPHAGALASQQVVPTIALLPGSSAIDNGDSSGAGLPSADQRGYARIVGNAVDIGAYESGATPAANTDLSVSGSGPSSVALGGQVTYTLTVTNNSSSAQSNVTLADDLPAGTTFVSWAPQSGWSFSAPATGSSSGAVTAWIATLPANTSASFSLVVQVAPSTALGTVISNTASVGPITGDPTPSDNTISFQTAVQAATSTSTVGLSATTAVYGQPVTLTATVRNTQTAATPSGNVTFYDGATKLEPVPVDANGVATLTVSTLGPGRHALTASFSDPAGNFVSTSSPAAAFLTITRASTTTTLATTTTTPVFSQAVTFTATVAAVAPSTPTPTGSVTFKDGTTVLRTVVLSGGSASFTTTNLAVASHTITATYNGNGNFKGSGPATSGVTVSQDTATAVVSSWVSSPVYGQAVTLKATLTAKSPGSGKPTGTVSFYDGTTFLGTAPLSNGVAIFKTTALAVGGNSITVKYDGDGNFLGTTSTPLAITVNQDTPTTKLTSSSATAMSGNAVTLTATVLAGAPGSGTPTGTVSFFDGSTLLNTVNLSGGVAQLSFTSTVLGKHKIKAVYNGDADFLSTTSAVLTETIT